MSFDELKKDLIEADAEVRSYFHHSEEYLKLKIFKILARFLTTILQMVLVGLGVMLILFFISLGIALVLCELYDSYLTGFLIVAGFYVVVTILLYIFRNRLQSPVIKTFSSHYFDRV